MKVLNLTLKKKWFDMVLSGQKNEEYREIKEYWIRRLECMDFDVVQFVNGYGRYCPRAMFELVGISKGVGREEWGAPKEPVYILHIGELISKGNIK